MAASIVLTANAYPNGGDNTQRREIVYGVATITPGDGTSPATGIPVTWSAMVSGNNGGVVQINTTKTAPQFVTFGAGTSATTLAASTAYVYNSNIPALIVTRAGSNVAATILADVVPFKAEWVRGV